MTMDDKQCEVYRDRVDEKLEVHDKRLDNHSSRLDELEHYRYTIDERISNLTQKVDDIAKSVKHFTGLIIGGWIGLIIFLIQQAMTK